MVQRDGNYSLEHRLLFFGVSLDWEPEIKNEQSKNFLNVRNGIH